MTEPAPSPTGDPADPASVEVSVAVTIDGVGVEVAAGTTLRVAAESTGVTIPTLCWAADLTPVSACRLCVVEVAGERTLVPACSRQVEPGMVVHTDSERVRRSRRLVLELLASSVTLDQAPDLVALMELYGADPERFAGGARVDEPVRDHDDLFVRDYERCVLCYKCVEACGDDAQHTWAIAVAGRGFEARISTEFDVALGASACVYCGNCIAVCPTNALQFGTEYALRAAGDWRPADQSVVRTVCGFCGVGCNLELRVQDERIVGVTSPADHDVTHGHLCVKGRFGWAHIHA